MDLNLQIIRRIGSGPFKGSVACFKHSVGATIQGYYIEEEIDTVDSEDMRNLSCVFCDLPSRKET